MIYDAQEVNPFNITCIYRSNTKRKCIHLNGLNHPKRKTNALKLSVPPWRSPAAANRSVHPSDGPTFAGGHWGWGDLDHRIT